MLVLKVVKGNMTPNYHNYNFPEFKYPMPNEDIGYGLGFIECPDWDPYPRCGNGLHGWLNGEGDPDCANPDLTDGKIPAKWLVIETDSVINIDNQKVKFRKGRVVFVGNRKQAIDFLESKKSLNPLANWKRIDNSDTLQFSGHFSDLKSTKSGENFQVSLDRTKQFSTKPMSFQIAGYFSKQIGKEIATQIIGDHSVQRSLSHSIQFSGYDSVQDCAEDGTQITGNSSAQFSEDYSIQISGDFCQQKTKNNGIQILKMCSVQYSGENSIQIAERGTIHKAGKGSVLIFRSSADIVVARVGYEEGELDPEKKWMYDVIEAKWVETEKGLEPVYSEPEIAGNL